MLQSLLSATTLDLLIIISSFFSPAPSSSSPLSLPPPLSPLPSPNSNPTHQPSLIPPLLPPPPPPPPCFRKCRNEDCVREKGKEWQEIEDLPWKDGQQGRNPDYEVLCAKLRKMASVNGRTVLLSSEVRVPASKFGGLGAEEGAEVELEASVTVLALQVSWMQ